MEAGRITQRDTGGGAISCASSQVSPSPDQDPTDAGTLSGYGPQKIICLKQNKLMAAISKAALGN